MHPGHDVFISEVYAEEVAAALAKWSAALCQASPSISPIVELLSPDLLATSLQPEGETYLAEPGWSTSLARAIPGTNNPQTGSLCAGVGRPVCWYLATADGGV